MKYKFLLPILLFALISTAFAAQPTKPKQWSNEFFKDILKKGKNAVDNFDKNEFYKGLEFTDNATGKKKKFEDLTETQKTLFKVFQGERLSLILNSEHLSWNAHLQQLEKEKKEEEKKKKDGPLINNPFNPEKKPENKPEKKPEKPNASIEETKKYIDSLFKIRKDMAVKFEAMITKEFDELKKSIPERDLKRYFDYLKKFNDKHKLIERKPKNG
jgi:hypothetical protein